MGKGYVGWWHGGCVALDWGGVAGREGHGRGRLAPFFLLCMQHV